MNFDKTPLNEFVTLQRGFDLPKDDRIEGNVPVVASTGIGGYHHEAKVSAPGVVIGRSGSIGGGQYIEQDFWPLNTTLWVKDFKGHDPRYVYYLMRSIDFSTFNVGSGVPTLNRNHLSSLLVNEQGHESEQRIAKYLGDIDDKIAVNTKTNQTLEEMAQAIFKSWFVDFDPVKAKMNGEQPEGMDEATASLFPDKLVESELGLIPEGWQLTNVGKVSECFDKHRIPLSKRQREQKQGIIPYYGATSVMDFVDEAIFDDIYLLLGEDGSVVKEDGTPFIQYIWGPAWVNNHAHVLKGIKSVSTEQLMLFFQQTNINAYVTGAVQLKINQKNMNSIPFIKASEDINERFYEVIAPLYAKVRAIKEENEQLAKLRDSLLPKLLSGEIELGTSEELVEAI
ncbi:TPA: restriction endonuclease subunit S [Vibrio cholerae]